MEYTGQEQKKDLNNALNDRRPQIKIAALITKICNDLPVLPNNLKEEDKIQILLFMKDDKITNFSKSKILDRIFDLGLDKLKFDDLNVKGKEKALFVQKLYDENLWSELINQEVSSAERQALISIAYSLFKNQRNIDLDHFHKLKKATITKILMMAVTFGRFEVASAIINLYPELINNQNNYNAKLMFAVVKQGNVELLKKILDHGVRINALDQDNNTALMFAAANGHVEIVEELLNRFTKIDVNRVNDQNITALMLAAYHGNLEIVKKLLDHEANVNIQNQNGDTALMLAIMQGHESIVKELLHREVNVNLKNKQNCTAATLAIISNQPQVALGLIQRIPKINMFTSMMQISMHIGLVLYAAEKGYLKIIEELLNKGTLLAKAKWSKGHTALYIAIKKGHAEVARELLKKGAQINYKKDSEIIRHIFQSDEVDIILALIKQLPMFFIKHESGDMLLWAAAHGHLNVVQALLNKGADINIKNKEGKTARDLAINNQHVDIVLELTMQELNMAIKANDQNKIINLLEFLLEIEKSQSLLNDQQFKVLSIENQRIFNLLLQHYDNNKLTKLENNDQKLVIIYVLLKIAFLTGKFKRYAQIVNCFQSLPEYTNLRNNLHFQIHEFIHQNNVKMFDTELSRLNRMYAVGKNNIHPLQQPPSSPVRSSLPSKP